MKSNFTLLLITHHCSSACSEGWQAGTVGIRINCPKMAGKVTAAAPRGAAMKDVFRDTRSQGLKSVPYLCIYHSP